MPPLYLATGSEPAVVALMESGVIGRMSAPAGGSLPVGAWAADNGAFSERFDEDRWWAWLQRMTPHADTCLFAVAPDVVGDAQATLDRSGPWLPRIRALGYPVALVAQDGLERLDVPWGAFDVLFIGGTTAWKLSPEAAGLVAEAHRRGKRTHMGRVNSYRRYRYASLLGIDSVDGTYLAYGPTVNLPKLRSWLHDQGDLFEDSVEPAVFMPEPDATPPF